MIDQAGHEPLASGRAARPSPVGAEGSCLAAIVAACLVAGGASAQPAPGPATVAPADLVMTRASICAPGPQAADIAARAVREGWTELSRRDALRLQALDDRSALVAAWRLGPQDAPTYLLMQTPDTPRPRRLTCEVLFGGVDPAAVQAMMADKGFGDALGAPRLQGPLPAGGRFVEWAAPKGSPWRLIALSVPLPPRKGPALDRIGFSGVQR